VTRFTDSEQNYWGGGLTGEQVIGTTLRA
jgi:hypothetical protein